METSARQPAPRAERAEIDELQVWLAASGHLPAALEPLPGAVSPRRYARLALAAGTTAILATYSADIRATCPRFLKTTALLAGAGVRVPKVLAADCERGFMLVEDMGPLTFADWAVATGRPWEELVLYFADALAQARRIAALPPAVVAPLSPLLGRELLEEELQKTWDLFLEPQRLLGDPAEREALAGLLSALCA